MFVVYILLIVIFLFGLFVFLIFPRPKHFRPNTDDFLKIENYAHRGLFDNKIVAENSLSAFKAAVKFGCGIELDVRLSKDGFPVVFHDRSLNRMCGVNKNVEDLNVDELKKMRLLDTADCIPTLREVLDLVDGSVPLLIEMKSDDTDCFVCPQSEILLRHYNGYYAVESFNPFALRWYKIHRPEILRGQLSSTFGSFRDDGHPVIGLFISLFLTNFLSRPDFVAFDKRFLSAASFTICTKYLQALPVGWTFRDANELKDSEIRAVFDAFIFEGFLPDVK